ncbi:MAG: sigma-70 family RNA polymerase sigma factor [Acidobacteria bacterium]|nr:sigma-70 family RNA polymerase sigma factor [Acidobacteriota bacterium]
MLFQLCAAQPQRDEYWLEFVRRFNPLLVRSITVAWRKSGQGPWPPAEIAADLLQDVYTAIVKNDFGLLRNFRGASEAEAEAYLAHAAINQTLSFLRARQALRRAADEVSLQAVLEEQGEASLATPVSSAAHSITESELINTLEKCFDGPNRKRDILIFLLYAREGYSPAEIAGLGVAELKETSIANLLGQMKSRLRKYLSGAV